ncbi:MAG: DUF1572 family protein [Bacteroidota bacterium]
MDRIEVFKKQFDYYKSLAEKSLDQLDDTALFVELEEGSNSIAVIMKHIAGNMLSRWTNIFEEDGEKEWRNRDEEFIDRFSGKKELMEYWNNGWDRLFKTLDELENGDLERTIYIRNMGTTVHDAIIRQICHYPYHIGQIVYAAKLLKGSSFVSLTIPKGESKHYNAERFEKEKSIKHFTEDGCN